MKLCGEEGELQNPYRGCIGSTLLGEACRIPGEADKLSQLSLCRLWRRVGLLELLQTSASVVCCLHILQSQATSTRLMNSGGKGGCETCSARHKSGGTGNTEQYGGAQRGAYMPVGKETLSVVV